MKKRKYLEHTIKDHETKDWCWECGFIEWIEIENTSETD